MLEGEFGDGELLLDVLDLGGSEARARQTVPEGLDLVFEINNVRVQGMSHGLGEIILQGQYLTGTEAGARGRPGGLFCARSGGLRKVRRGRCTGAGKRKEQITRDEDTA